MHSDLFAPSHQETEASRAGEVLARRGSMVGTVRVGISIADNQRE